MTETDWRLVASQDPDISSHQTHTHLIDLNRLRPAASQRHSARTRISNLASPFSSSAGALIPRARHCNNSQHQKRREFASHHSPSQLLHLVFSACDCHPCLSQSALVTESSLVEAIAKHFHSLTFSTLLVDLPGTSSEADAPLVVSAVRSMKELADICSIH